MGTLSNSVQTAGLREFVASQKTLTFRRPISADENPGLVSYPEDNGLGCMRGLAVAMLCNIILAAVIVAGWELWRLFR